MKVPINCSRCGRFVGYRGKIDVSEVDIGVYEMGYPLCEKCLEQDEKSTKEKLINLLRNDVYYRTLFDKTIGLSRILDEIKEIIDRKNVDDSVKILMIRNLFDPTENLIRLVLAGVLKNHDLAKFMNIEGGEK